MDRENWTLLTLAAADTPLQPVQLQKSLFLLSRNVRSKVLGRNFYTFEPYDYGPFCKDIYGDTEILEAKNLAKITRPPVSRFNTYSVTPEGSAIADDLRQHLSAKVVDYLDRVVGFVQSVSFSQLVSAIYKAYPEMRKNSVFRG